MTPRHRLTQPVALVAGAVMVLLALSGCMKLDMDVAFNKDDTVEGTVVMAASKEALETMGASFDDLVGDEDPFDGDATSEPYEDDTFVGRTYTLKAVPLEDFGDETMSVTHEDGKFTVDGSLPLDMEAGMDAEQLSGAEITITFRFPGPVESSNGRIDGNAVTWEGEPGTTLEMQAVAKDSGSSFPVLLVVLLVVGLLVVVGVVLAVVLVKRRSTKQLAPAPFGAAPYGAPAPGAPYAGMPPSAPGSPERRSPRWRRPPEHPRSRPPRPHPRFRRPLRSRRRPPRRTPRLHLRSSLRQLRSSDGLR